MGGGEFSSDAGATAPEDFLGALTGGPCVLPAPSQEFDHPPRQAQQAVGVRVVNLLGQLVGDREQPGRSPPARGSGNDDRGPKSASGRARRRTTGPTRPADSGPGR